MRRVAFLLTGLFACSSPSPVHDDAGAPGDAGHPDAGAPDAGAPVDAGVPDAGDEGGCGCGSGGVCGTGMLGDPLRCCDYQQDDCVRDAGPCAAPVRCSPRPDCCASHSCGPNVGCTGTRVCVSWLGGDAPADGTPCDDGRACSSATPPPELPDCLGLDGSDAGDNCTRDHLAPFPFGTSCPSYAPSCSGSSSAFGGNGGPIRDGRCCPSGMACDLNPDSGTWGKCLGNLGWGGLSNDVCRGGVCASDVTCP